MALTILYIVVGYYLLSLLYQAIGLFVRYQKALRSPEVRLNLSLFTHDSREGAYRFLTITPWFYEETEKCLSVVLTLAGFRISFVPVGTMEPLIREYGEGYLCWQVRHDSVDVLGGTKGPVPVAWEERGRGFSGGEDLLFMSEGGDEAAHERFRSGSATERNSTGKLTARVIEVIRPSIVIEKVGNRWLLGFREPEERTLFLRFLLHRVSEKVLRKNGIAGAKLEIDSTAADRFISRGQVRWWVTGKIDGDNVVFDAEGIRPGEATSADWALISIPFKRGVQGGEAYT